MVFGLPLAQADRNVEGGAEGSFPNDSSGTIPAIELLQPTINELKEKGLDSIKSETTDQMPDSIKRLIDSLRQAEVADYGYDSLYRWDNDSLLLAQDSIVADTIASDTTKKKKKGFLDDIISGHNKDSLEFDVRENIVHIHREGQVDYQEMSLKADYMQINMETKQIYAYGYTDSLGAKSRPEFLDKGEVYTMDTIHYNIDTEKAKIKGVARQESEGYLMAKDVKKMAGNVMNIMDGRYTTCDNHEHPHFYLAMTRAKVLPGEKVIVAPSYLVMEDVPIYFLGIPFGFFPVTTSRSSGFIIPTFGEEYTKGFFLRDGGYYFAFNDYVDATILGGIYTLGSWEASVSSRYIKRYTYSGMFDVRYAKTLIGEKADSSNYINSGSFSVRWTHQQDPKFRPNSSFSASVNFSSSDYTQHGTSSLDEHLTTQTSSSIAYSKSWPGKPFSFSTNMSHSQNSRNKTVSLTFPNVSFNVSTIYPFKRKTAIGKQKWYEKIQTRYSGQLTNSVTVDEKDLFKDGMFKQMRHGVKHSIPVSASFNLFNYINLSPSLNYNAYWYFRKVDKDWDPVQEAVVPVDTTYGFYRLYDYSLSASLNTTVYGTFQFKNEKAKIQAFRHVMTPSLSFSYTPDFGQAKYGFYKPVQSSRDGNVSYYSPYEGNAYGLPSRGESMRLGFSLGNTLQMKVRSEKDTSGTKIVKLIDQFNLSGSYNFLADEFKLSNISASLRSTVYKGINLNVNATFDPYQVEVVDGRAKRVNKLMTRKGSLARLVSASTGFSYSFNSGGSSGTGGDRGSMNDVNSGALPTPDQNNFFDQDGMMDPSMKRAMMTSQYYDFNIPWNLGINYSFRYTNDGAKRNVTQTLNFQGSVNLTDKWGINFSGGYDFDKGDITFGQFSVSRDLHCWQMNLSWVPLGPYKSWSFNISVKSNVLRDLKYDKRSSRFDSLYD